MKKNSNYLLLILVLLVIISCNTSNGAKSDRNSNKKQIDNYSNRIDSLIQTSKPRSFNGVILITQNGKTKYSKAFGFANFEKKTPLTLENNFRIQSNSKQITAVLTLKEVEKGKIDLQSRIREYLPEIKQPWADTVTVHQLLNMSSGIISIDKPLIFEPGTDYRYSNPAYGILGKIIEKVTGNKYVNLANNLFADQKMNNTFCYEMGMDANHNMLVNGYTISNGQPELVDFYSIERGRTEEEWNNFIPAGGIISNLEDLNTWDINLHSGKILKPKTYKQMVDYNITGQHDAFGNEKIGYGYGVRIDNKSSFKNIGHAGRGLGFASTKFYIPEKNIDVIMLENVYNSNTDIVYHFEKEIREIVLNSSLLE